MGNTNLKNAKKNKNDEFYTQLSDIEKELSHYRDFLRGKIVFCNCDDPYESNFFKYFASNFNFLSLKKLIATCYCGSPVSGTQLLLKDIIDLEPKSDRQAYKIEISEVIDTNKDGAVDITDVAYLIKNKKNILTLLDGDGDFRSNECIELLKQSDVVITNPPFSLFREYVAQLIEYDKKFVIIGNKNSITYKEVFKFIKDNKIWLGYSHPNNFLNPDGTLAKLTGLTRWFTNIGIPKRNEELILYKRYYMTEEDKNNPNYTNPDYPKYDNYDAINVDKVSDIPVDYDGVMGVPITFLDKYTPKQFDIIKFRKGDDNRDLEYTKNGGNLERESLQSKNPAVLPNTRSSSSELLTRQDSLGTLNVIQKSMEEKFTTDYSSNEFEIVDLGIVGSCNFTCNKKMEILDKNGNGTGKYTFNAKGTLYKKFNPQTDKIPSFKDVETGELYSSIYARILIKHRRKIK